MTQRNTQGVVLALAIGLASAGCGAAPEGTDAGTGPAYRTEATATATDTSTIPADALYVSPTGTSSGNGTAASPYDLATAIKKVAAGKYIAVKGGTYKLSAMVRITTALSGSAGAMKYLVNVPGERVILDFSAQATSSSNYGLRLDGSYWYVKGLEIQGAGDNGMYLTGSNNVVEGCTFRGNRDAGFQLSTSSSTARASWPSNNLVLNCESYDNHDATGENADGFAAKLAVGPGNVFRGCVSHHNSDDGWDLFTKTSYGVIDPIVIDRCVAFANGSLTDGTTFSAGDRNGFKLGGSDMAVAHVVTRSIAFGNGKNGFTWNSNPGVIWLVNNTAWDNSVGNFKFDNTSTAVFVNNVSFWTSGSGQNDRAGANSGTVVANNAFWDTSKKTLWGFGGTAATVTRADFQAVAAPTSFPLPRLADGSFDLGALGKLAAGSALVNAGVVPGKPSGAGADLPFDPAAYYVGAPDAGAIELR